ncbi:hypothetical protein CCACVL1_26213 [Corchorus capsularis]|uniref:Uncharacterized protein n=1 Tax=Corchorus capsularis TaxID=210143 RepID=A0A1R3GFL3_COCAP|nr:hypothetical protein CCACVL1_26213 [Corchorus capsularis]
MALKREMRVSGGKLSKPKLLVYRELLSTRFVARTSSLELFLSNRQIVRRGKC